MMLRLTCVLTLALMCVASAQDCQLREIERLADRFTLSCFRTDGTTVFVELTEQQYGTPPLIQFCPGAPQDLRYAVGLGGVRTYDTVSGVPEPCDVYRPNDTEPITIIRLREGIDTWINTRDNPLLRDGSGALRALTRPEPGYIIAGGLLRVLDLSQVRR
jgi:hypothetical protein